MKIKGLKRNVIGALIVIILILCIGLLMKNDNNTLNNTSINEESIIEELDENLIGAYIQQGEEYVKADTIPTSGYEFNAEKSYCKMGDVIQEDITLFYDMNTQTLTVNPITKNKIKCYLYFDEKASGSEYILASPNAPTSHTTDWTGEESYYYTGNPDNWIQFAGFYWRIIRINGDGSIRMIYQGVADSPTPDETNETGAGTQIGTGVFNNSANRSYYVGLVHDGSSQHGYGINSTIMNTLNNWYNSNLARYEINYIDTGAGFCSDRNLQSGSWSATGNHTYAAYGRLINSNNPNLQCSDVDILSKENGRLPYPIGLVTADEAALTGITWNNANTGSYLYTGQNYWTITPYGAASEGWAGVFYVSMNGNLYWYRLFISVGIRPVINLRADVSLSGSGTTSDPFKVVGT